MMQTMNEIIEEVNEDLQLQANLLLTNSEQQALLNSGLLFLTAERIKPYIAKIRNYLRETLQEDRVWTMYKATDISNNLLGFYTLVLNNDSNCN
ncbi:hypothetical protein EFO67_07605 [Limosilactobacillus reuteri]|uniref:Uncharacterized protein n=2 Tax=Limosilactobacillus reuteri TaxID=1598 RepID=A0A2T5Q678_LIMRT|nr:hypothetical protein [Limosilactobacillus reuteri]PTV05295.1 hypothetical protein DB325_00915 [Limosilactobacillus reuteri]